jgi:hypothetical protein
MDALMGGPARPRRIGDVRVQGQLMPEREGLIYM